MSRFRDVNWNDGKNYNLTVEERKDKFGRTFIEEDRQNLSIKGKARFSNPLEKDKLRKKALEQFNNPEMIKKHKDKCDGHKGKVWMNNGINNKRVLQEDISSFEELGFVKGRLLGEVKFYEHGNRKRNFETGRYI